MDYRSIGLRPDWQEHIDLNLDIKDPCAICKNCMSQECDGCPISTRLTEKQIQELKDYVLAPYLKSKRGNKKNDEYPFHSPSQIKRRKAPENSFGDGIDFIGNDLKVYDIK